MPPPCLPHAGDDGGNSVVFFRDVSGCSVSGIDRCPELLEQITLPMSEGTAAASSMLADFWGITPGNTNCKSNLPAGNSANYPVSFGHISFLMKFTRVGVYCFQGSAGSGFYQLRTANCSFFFPTPHSVISRW